MHKESSSFAPDCWIRFLNKRIPNMWPDLRRTRKDPFSVLKKTDYAKKLLSSIPDWCVMPTMHPFFMLGERYGRDFCFAHMNEVMTIGTMYTWRLTKGVYRFAPEIYEALTTQPLSGSIPCECLFHLPEWAVYIETPGLQFEHKELDGFIAHLDYNLFSLDIDLQFALFAKGINQPRMIALPLKSGTLDEAMERVTEIDNAFIPGSGPKYVGTKEEYRHTFSVMLQLLLYLCSEEPDIPFIEHPKARMRSSGSIPLPPGPRVWDVGVRISSAIRKYKERQFPLEDNYSEPAESGTVGHCRPRPHVRCSLAHLLDRPAYGRFSGKKAGPAVASSYPNQHGLEARNAGCYSFGHRVRLKKTTKQLQFS